MNNSELTSFTLGNSTISVTFVETQTVKEGVECDIYAFNNDASKDLAVVRVAQGYKTPLQRVLLGDKTVEGLYSGLGTLTITDTNSETVSHTFETSENREVIVRVGQIMQWHANKNSDLVFYEICEPPYIDGRFENLAEKK